MSIQKIMTLTVFLSAALMASLFVFHMKHKPSSPTLPANTGTVFTVTRDIKPFKLVTNDQGPFTLSALRDHWTLLFFGFTHCSTICPITLKLMDQVYTQLKPAYPNLQVVLISLDPDRDSPAQIAQYAKGFNSQFIGVTGKIQEIRKLQSQFGIYSEKVDETNGHYQIQHTASIMLINPQAKWAALLSNGISPAQFSDAFKFSTGHQHA